MSWAKRLAIEMKRRFFVVLAILGAKELLLEVNQAVEEKMKGYRKKLLEETAYEKEIITATKLSFWIL